MLRKLLKYELKSTGRLLGLLYLAIIVVAAVGGFLARFNIDNENMAPTFFVLMIIYILLVMALMIVTIIMIIGRFYKNMLLGEGYLMHTIPVPSWMHILSKTISAFIWEIVAAVIVLVSGLIFIGTTGVWSEVCKAMYIDQMLEVLSAHTGMIVLFVATLLVALIRIILSFYAAMSIGGTANEHKAAFSILAFVVILIIMNIVSTVVNFGMIFKIDEMNADFMQVSFIRTIIIDAVFSVLFFFTSNFMISKKLNLQ